MTAPTPDLPLRDPDARTHEVLGAAQRLVGLNKNVRMDLETGDLRILRLVDSDGLVILHAESSDGLHWRLHVHQDVWSG